jgi:tetratricopeptide (TPR) repeat protein
MTSYSRLATVLHRLGQLTQAQQVFAQAERLQQQAQPHYPYLYSLPGAWYCAFLLDMASNRVDFEQVLERGEKLFEWRVPSDSLLTIALEYLSLARTYQALQQPQIACAKFNIAVKAIQKAGSIMNYPEFYLARANFYLSQNELPKAKADIETANQTITRCGMKLYAVDAALLQARLQLASNKNNKKTALNFCEQAEMLITETGYHLRDEALAALKQSLRNL